MPLSIETNSMGEMEIVSLKQLKDRLSAIAGVNFDNQQAYHIVNNILRIPKAKKYHYDWDYYFRMEDSGKVGKLLKEYLSDTSQKIKPKKQEWVIEPPQMEDADMEKVSRDLLKKDEVWYEMRKRLGRIIREELFRVC